MKNKRTIDIFEFSKLKDLLIELKIICEIIHKIIEEKIILEL